MSLASRLAAPPAPKGSKTVLDVWVDGLDEKDRAAVDAAVRNPEWRHVDLQRVFQAEGAPKVADTTFGAWRRSRLQP